MRFHVVSALVILLALGAVVVAADPSGADLLKAAKSGDEKARIVAIDRLVFEGDIEGTVPLLIELLRDRSPEIRIHAAHSLGQIGPKAAPAMRYLVRAAVTRNMVLRREIIKAIRKIRPHSPIALHLLARSLASDDSDIRAQALAALTRAGKLAVPLLARALEDDKTDYWAALALSEIGPDAAEAVPALMRVVKKDDKPEDRREAILALAMIGSASAPAVPELIDVIENRDETLIGPAIFAIGRIGPDAKAAKPALEKLAKDPSIPADKLAIAKAARTWALARIDPENKELAKEAIPLLAEQLTSERPEIRQFAVYALVDLKPDPEIARPAIDKALKSASPEALDHVVNAFVSIRKAAVPELIDILQDDKIPTVRPRVAAILGKMGPEAKEAIPALIKVASDKNPLARREALFALAEIGAGKDAVAVAVKALDDDNMEIRHSACFLLAKIGPNAIDAKERLVKNLDGEDELLAMVSAWAMSYIDPTCKETCPKSVPLLIKALQHHGMAVRLKAIESLARLGPLAKDALPALREMAKDDDPLLSKAAAAAVKAIQK